MTSEEIGQAIVGIIGEIVPDEDCSGLDPDKNLREQLDLDSMDFLDIVMELRKKYGVEVPEADYPRLATLNSCIEYLAPRMAGA
ncbi:MAG: acyl carrier protein [Lentisphaeria bacterium]|nr:acyl carrier protein [Lentisphaeria bacterium]